MTRADNTPDERFPWEEEVRDAAPRPPADAEARHGATPSAEEGGVTDGAVQAALPTDLPLPEIPPLVRERPVAPKEYYSISEVCELVDLKPHVLRYWEGQFQLLNPSKNRSGNRVYQRKEIRLILLVKRLLYEEKYTVEGAKARLDRMRRGGDIAEATSQAMDAQMLELLRQELQELQRILTPPGGV